VTTGERDPELLHELGVRVANASKVAGLDQTKLAEVAGVSRVFVQQLWRGGRFDGKPWAPKPDNVMAVVNALNAELNRRGDADAAIDQREALRLAGVDERDADQYLPKPGRPTVSATHLAELVGKLTHRQREAIVEVVESMIYPTTADEPGESDDGAVHRITHEEKPRSTAPGPVQHITREEAARD
jgi:transcriptional regulator with XRE-family HTH domain